jgi:excinuclease ABC subunit C
MPTFQFDPHQYPNHPGCYLMKNTSGQVLYVGKAKNLRRRLASYFREDPGPWKVKQLVPEIAEIEVILVHNEVESLVLENNLIKRYRPPYNSFLVSDKSGYPYILLTREEYPRYVRYKRNVMNKTLKGLQEQDCDKRFGPYLSHQFIEELLNFVNGKFKLRVCDPLPSRACLLYHMGKCSAPCEHKIDPAAYTRLVEGAAVFLSQPNTTLIEHMKAHMLECAQRLEFERAQRIKEQVEALEIGMSQQVVERDLDYDQEVLYFGEEHILAAEIRLGALTGLRLSKLEKMEKPGDASRVFILSHYAQGCPPELIVNQVEDPDHIEEALSAANRRQIRLLIPSAGPEHDLLGLCKLNLDYRVGAGD